MFPCIWGERTGEKKKKQKQKQTQQNNTVDHKT